MDRIPHWYDMMLIMRLRRVRFNAHITHTSTHSYALSVFMMMSCWWKWPSIKASKIKFMIYIYMMILDVFILLISLVMILLWSFLYLFSLLTCTLLSYLAYDTYQYLLIYWCYLYFLLSAKYLPMAGMRPWL